MYYQANMDKEELSVDFGRVLEAATRLAPYAHRTPVLRSEQINQRLGLEVFFKAENLQRVGAFKFRGAMNACLLIPEAQRKNGVVTHSSGNHAQGLALAAKVLGMKCTIVMPTNAPLAKRQSVLGYGATIVDCEPTLEAREAAASLILSKTNGYFVPPYDHPDVIAGQGTAALELINEVPELDVIIAPVGGGGLLSGTAIAVDHLVPSARTWGAEPKGASDAFESLKHGERLPMPRPKTIADGLRTSLGKLNFEIISNHVERILLTSDESILEAMRWCLTFLKSVVEPSGAVPLAALIQNRALIPADVRRVGLIVSGGNVDLEQFSWTTLR